MLTFFKREDFETADNTTLTAQITQPYVSLPDGGKRQARPEVLIELLDEVDTGKELVTLLNTEQVRAFANRLLEMAQEIENETNPQNQK